LPGAAAYPADDPGCAVPVQSAAVSGEEGVRRAGPSQLLTTAITVTTAADFLAGKAGQEVCVLGD
jgi:hypothetical protein